MSISSWRPGGHLRLHLFPEKNPQIQELCKLVKEAGYSLAFSPTMEEALERLPNDQPDVLIFDVDSAVLEEAGGLEKLVDLCEVAEIALLPVVNVESHALDLNPISKLPCLYYPFQSQDVLFKLENEARLRDLNRQILSAQDTLFQARSELQASFESAAFIQRSLFPQCPPNVSQFQFAWNFIPCEQQGVGGDLFNVMQLDENHLAIYVLDVSGHGFPAAMVTVSISQALSPKIGQVVKQSVDEPPYYRISSPPEVLGYLNSEYPMERFEKFFTICYAVLDMRNGRICYSNAGHPLPVLIRREGSVLSLTERGTIIGLLDSPYPQGEVFLRPGDRLFFYTDGIVEYQNEASEFFGEQRLYHQLSSGIQSPLDKACEGIIKALRDFGGEQALLQDDITLLGVEYRGMAG